MPKAEQTPEAPERVQKLYYHRYRRFTIMRMNHPVHPRPNIEFEPDIATGLGRLKTDDPDVQELLENHEDWGFRLFPSNGLGSTREAMAEQQRVEDLEQRANRAEASASHFQGSLEKALAEIEALKAQVASKKDPLRELEEAQNKKTSTKAKDGEK